MKTKQELLQMLYSRLAELQDGRIRHANPEENTTGSADTDV